ncbi:MAG: DUF1127 domain-containing protein [Aquamicrobium sp.]|uniref:DUF1127 domain-containing protein n=1 Tax=Aquamicrobium sp. TaxID=1872579 RepID=UPI00349ED55E|nr:DUF1127 domain-containing protein [Aquamicrobium sp.]
MSALDRSSSMFASGRPAPITDTLRGLARAFANRRQLDHLRDLSDRGLADIGLMRLDLDFARRAPLGVDPTRRLASVARERAHS